MICTFPCCKAITRRFSKYEFALKKSKIVGETSVRLNKFDLKIRQKLITASWLTEIDHKIHHLKIIFNYL